MNLIATNNMKTLLWIFLLLDCLIFLYSQYDDYVKGANIDWIPIILFLAFIGLGWWLRDSSPKWSLFILGLPVMLILFDMLTKNMFKH
jgi:hypothetical protein